MYPALMSRVRELLGEQIKVMATDDFEVAEYGEPPWSLCATVPGDDRSVIPLRDYETEGYAKVDHRRILDVLEQIVLDVVEDLMSKNQDVLGDKDLDGKK